MLGDFEIAFVNLGKTLKLFENRIPELPHLVAQFDYRQMIFPIFGGIFSLTVGKGEVLVAKVGDHLIFQSVGNRGVKVGVSPVSRQGGFNSVELRTRFGGFDARIAKLGVDLGQLLLGRQFTASINDIVVFLELNDGLFVA